jgi:hypothetical protein
MYAQVDPNALGLFDWFWYNNKEIFSLIIGDNFLS